MARLGRGGDSAVPRAPGQKGSCVCGRTDGRIPHGGRQGMAQVRAGVVVCPGTLVAVLSAMKTSSDGLDGYERAPVRTRIRSSDSRLALSTVYLALFASCG